MRSGPRLRGQWRGLQRQLAEHGYTVGDMTRGGHYPVLDEAGKRVGTLPTSAGDRRSYLNCRSDLRRTLGVHLR
jgi:hypothetical protein